MSARSPKKGRWPDQALGLLHDLNERVACASGRQDGADGILDLFSSRLHTSRAAVGIAYPSGGLEVVSVRGMTAEVFRRRCEGGGDVFNGLLSSGKGAVVLLTSGRAVSALATR